MLTREKISPWSREYLWCLKHLFHNICYNSCVICYNSSRLISSCFIIRQTLVMYTTAQLMNYLFCTIGERTRESATYRLNWFSCFELKVFSTRHKERVDSLRNVARAARNGFVNLVVEHFSWIMSIRSAQNAYAHCSYNWNHNMYIT